MAKYTEVEWNLRLQAPATGTEIYEFRVYDGSTPLTYAVTPQLTVSAGTNYSETGRQINGVATVAVADQADYNDLPVSVPITATVTAPTQSFGHLGNFNETGRSIPVVATVAATDQVDFKDPALATSITATVTTTPSLLKLRETVTVSGTASVATTISQADLKDLLLAVPVVATVTAPTQTFTHLGSFDETGRAVPVVATADATIQVDYKSNVGLAIPAVATVTAPVDKRKNLETALTVPVVATNTAVTQVDFKNLLNDVSVAVYVDCTDLHQSPGHFDETNRDVSVLAIVATVTEQTDYKQLGLATAAVATVSVTDLHKRFELSRSVAIVASTTSTPLHKRFEPVGLPVTASIATVDQGDFEDHPVTVSVTATVTVTDLLRTPLQTLTISVTGSVSSTSRVGIQEGLSFDALASVTSIDALAVIASLTVIMVIASIRVTDFKSRAGITTLNGADILFLGDASVDKIYVGASQAWP